MDLVWSFWLLNSIPRFAYLFPCWWTFRLFLILQYCNGHFHTSHFVYLWEKFLWDIHPEVELLCHRVCTNFLNICKFLYKMAVSIYIIPCFPTLLLTLVISLLFLNVLQSDGYKRISCCCFNLPFPNDNEVEHFFKWLWSTYWSFRFCKLPICTFAVFSIKFPISFLPYIFWILICFAHIYYKYFLQICYLSVQFAHCVLCRKEIFILNGL